VKRILLADADATRAMGVRIGQALLASEVDAPLVIGLSGELGAGKTTLVGGLLEAMGHAGPARSPTYSLIEPYRLAGRDVHHCDFYRLRDPRELDDLGLRDLLVPRSVLLVEWPERAADRLGTVDLSLQLSYSSSSGRAPGRELELTAETAAGRAVLAGLSIEPT